jgi:hypothetical protein
MRTRRLVVVLALTLGLAALPAVAAGPADRTVSAWQGLGGLWSWLAERILVHSQVGAACDESLHIDPDGRCSAGLLAFPGGESSHIDPNGDQSLLIDPDGDQSSLIDPNG